MSSTELITCDAGSESARLEVQEEIIVPPLNPRSLHQGSGQEILLIDDEPTILQIAAAMLKRLGYVPSCFESPEEAVEAFRANPDHYHLVITDMTMTGMRGDEVAAILRSLRPGIPIILATGYGSTIGDENASQMGFDLLLAKPYLMPSLAECVAEGLQKYRV